jgi:hypothetical protein
MKPGTYSENEIPENNINCVHDLYKKPVEVYFFAGGYYHKMRKCKKCGSFISYDMVDHPHGVHEFAIPIPGGFMQCKYCGIAISIVPVIEF